MTIVDNQLITNADCGSNFYLSPWANAPSRAEFALPKLKEIKFLEKFREFFHLVAEKTTKQKFEKIWFKFFRKILNSVLSKICLLSNGPTNLNVTCFNLSPQNICCDSNFDFSEIDLSCEISTHRKKSSSRQRA